MRRVKSFAQQLREVRDAKRVTFEELAFRAQQAARRRGLEKGPSRDAIAQLAGKPRRRPRETTVLVLGEALEVETGEFPAYDLARAREMLDEHIVGDDALANLAKIGDVLGLTGTAPRLNAADAELPTIRRLAAEAEQARRRRGRG